MSEYILINVRQWRLDRLDQTIKRYCHGISRLDNGRVPNQLNVFNHIKILQESPLILERYLNLEQKSQLFDWRQIQYLERLQSRSLADLF